MRLWPSVTPRKYHGNGHSALSVAQKEGIDEPRIAPSYRLYGFLDYFATPGPIYTAGRHTKYIPQRLVEKKFIASPASTTTAQHHQHRHSLNLSPAILTRQSSSGQSDPSSLTAHNEVLRKHIHIRIWLGTCLCWPLDQVSCIHLSIAFVLIVRIKAAIM